METFISDDFLQYAQEHFERRYPSGQSRLLSKRKCWTFSRSFLSTYDDCILQIDRGLDQLYRSSEWSLGSRALSVPGSGRLGRAFFHDNVFAIARLLQYRSSVGDEWRNFPLPEHLEQPDRLFASGDLPRPGLSYGEAQELLSLDLAALFVYPEASAPHPDPVQTLLSSRGARRGNWQEYDWIVERLRTEFGFTAVDILEEETTRNLVAVVYDRGAKDYWAALPVGRGYWPSLVRNGLSRDLLERWIDEAKAQFSSERRALRLPKQ